MNTHPGELKQNKIFFQQNSPSKMMDILTSQTKCQQQTIDIYEAKFRDLKRRLEDSEMSLLAERHRSITALKEEKERCALECAKAWRLLKEEKKYNDQRYIKLEKMVEKLEKSLHQKLCVHYLGVANIIKAIKKKSSSSILPSRLPPPNLTRRKRKKPKRRGRRKQLINR